MKILIRGAGDLATGIAWEMYHDGHQVVMTDVAVPLAVRRAVALSRAVYESSAKVEDIEGVLAKDLAQVEQILEEGRIPVLVDPEGKIREVWNPQVVVDCIMAKVNLGTGITDAELVIGVGPGFTAGSVPGADVHCVIETVRGAGLGTCIWEGSALPNTGVPGEVGGYTIERLLKASADGIMEPVAKIGDIVSEGQIVAYTGGVPVRSRLTGIVRGMLQAGVPVTEGLKIGDVDARIRSELAVTISDKAHKIGCGVREAIAAWKWN